MEKQNRKEDKANLIGSIKPVFVLLINKSTNIKKIISKNNVKPIQYFNVNKR